MVGICLAKVHILSLSGELDFQCLLNFRKLNFGVMENGFSALPITRQFLDALSGMGLNNPTEIQEKAIVPALAGQDVLGIAETGSGKTLAYLLPLVLKIKYAKDQHPRALVLAPSKELVIQIHRVLTELCVNTDIRSVCLYGGVGKKEQVVQLDAGCDIVVSTPGRLIDIYSYGHVYLRQVRTLVLDEADRMMEMGFMPQLRRILEVIPSKRQNLLFSATFPDRVETMAAEFLEFPTRVMSAEQGRPVDQLHQAWYPVPNFRSKLQLITWLLQDDAWNRVMIFCRTKDTAERVYKYLDRHNVCTVRVLHANKGQNTRINALDEFRDGHVRLLVTTDVTSRGIDVDNVSHVVNFELPKSPEDYLHRIGRTARIKREGMAISLVDPAEEFLLDKIIDFADNAIEKLPWPEAVKLGEDLPGERQEIMRELDRQKKLLDPTFKGAFHDRKRKPTPKKAIPKKNPSKPKRRSGKK